MEAGMPAECVVGLNIREAGSPVLNEIRGEKVAAVPNKATRDLFSRARMLDRESVNDS